MNVTAKLTSENLIRLAGLSALMAGACYVLVGVFHPANIPSSVTTTRWEVVHVLACAMCFFGVLGMTGLYARQRPKMGWLGLAGYLMLELWLVLIMGFSFVEAFVLPHVASTSPAFVQAWMGCSTVQPARSTSGCFPPCGLSPHRSTSSVACSSASRRRTQPLSAVRRESVSAV
jgi:hypothetical protein